MRNECGRHRRQASADPIRLTGSSNGAQPRRRVRHLWLLLIPVLVTACGSDTSQTSIASAPTLESGTAPPDVKVDPEGEGQGVPIVFEEWNVIGPTQIETGTVALAVKNEGTMNHQLSIVAAETYESLPRRENGSVITEELDTSQVVLVTEALFAGFPAETFEVELETGTYVFFCAFQSSSGGESHVGLGQRRIVTVT